MTSQFSSKEKTTWENLAYFLTMLYSRQLIRQLRQQGMLKYCRNSTDPRHGTNIMASEVARSRNRNILLRKTHRQMHKRRGTHNGGSHGRQDREAHFPKASVAAPPHRDDCETHETSGNAYHRLYFVAAGTVHHPAAEDTAKGASENAG